MRHLRKVCTILLVLAMITMIAACSAATEEGPTSSSSQGSSESSSQSTSQPAAEPVTITMRTWNPEEKAFAYALDEWNKLDSNIDVELIAITYDDHIATLKINIASGEGPDIYGLQVGAQMSQFEEFSLKLDDRCQAKWGNDWQNLFIKAYVDRCANAAGDHYALPVGGNLGMFIWCNNNLLKAHSLSVPQNYSDLLTASTTLRAADEYPLLVGGGTTIFLQALWLCIASDINLDMLYDALEGKASFAEPEMVQALEIYKKCFDDGIIQDGALGMSVYMDCENIWSAGESAMYFNGSWTVADVDMYFIDQKVDTAITTIDWNEDSKKGPVYGEVDVALAINPRSEHLEEAWEFYAWYVEHGGQYIVDGCLQYMPYLQGVSVAADNFSSQTIDMLDEMLTYTNQPMMPYAQISSAKMQQGIFDALTGLANSEMTPAEAGTFLDEVAKEAGLKP